MWNIWLAKWKLFFFTICKVGCVLWFSLVFFFFLFAFSHSASLSHTQTSCSFSHQSPRGLEPLIVSQAGSRGKVLLGVLGGPSREAGKAGHSCPHRKETTSSYGCPRGFPEYLSPKMFFHQQKKKGCVLLIHLRIERSVWLSNDQASNSFVFYRLSFELVQSGLYGFQSVNVQTNGSFMAVFLNSASLFGSKSTKTTLSLCLTVFSFSFSECNIFPSSTLIYTHFVISLSSTKSTWFTIFI